MTKDEAIKKHREMWNWLADNPSAYEIEYLAKFDSEADLEGNCYLCEYTGIHCEKCPLEWPGGTCFSKGGLYGAWCSAAYNVNPEVASRIAKEIAGLPERRTDVKTGE